MTTILTTAMEKEYDVINKSVKKCNLMERWGTSLYVQRTGIGKVNAASHLTELLEDNMDETFDRVISIGCAGAASPTLKVGDIVIGNSYCYHDVYCGEPNSNGQVQGLPAVFPSSFEWIKNLEKYTLGTIASGDWFVNTREKVEQILAFLPRSYNVCAIDMESAALAQVCYKRGIAFTSIRIISDNPLLPNQQEQYDTFWDEMAEKAFEELSNILAK